MLHLIVYVALALFALLAVWLALEPLASRLTRSPRLRPWAPRLVGPLAVAAAYFAGVRKAFKYPRLIPAMLRSPIDAINFGAMPAISGGSPELDVLDDLTESEKAEAKKISEAIEGLQGNLAERIKEMKATGENKEEVEKREAELAEKVDKLIGLQEKRDSSEVADFKAELKERFEKLEQEMKEMGDLPAGSPAGAARGSHPSVKDRYEGDNFFMDLKEGLRDHTKADAIREYEEKFRNEARQKAWAIEDLEDADLVLPDIQQALPLLRAQIKIVRLFRELRTASPSVEFPVYKSGLSVEHVEPGDPKPESEPTFDLEVARVFTIAGITDVPNQTLEDFPAARGWISTELGTVTGIQEENDVLNGDGTGEPLGLFQNKDIPHRKADAVKEASAGRNIISSIFRAAQQVRVKGFTEPTDVGLNPAVWTDVVLSFENNIGFLYGPPQMESVGGGPPIDQPPARILGLPVTWSSYIPTNVQIEKVENTSPIVVGNFQDGIVLRRAPFRIDIDTSVGFKKNMTCFRGEERMGFIVVRPKSFVIVDEVVPSAVE